MKTTTPLPSLERAQHAVAAARELLAAWMTPVCRGHVYPMHIRRGTSRYLYYTWERCIRGRRIQRTIRVDQAERITAGIRAMAGLQARLDAYYDACETLALVECMTPAAADEKKRTPSRRGKTRAGTQLKKPPRQS